MFVFLQEMAALRANMAVSSVNVEVDAAPQQDLNQVMQEIRAQYEGIAEKNRKEMEAWYKGKVRRRLTLKPIILRPRESHDKSTASS